VKKPERGRLFWEELTEEKLRRTKGTYLEKRKRSIGKSRKDFLKQNVEEGKLKS